MATTKRASILDALIAMMANIDGTGTFHNTLLSRQYTSSYKHHSNVGVANMPFLCLIPGPSNYTPLTALEYTSGETEQQLDGWLVSVIGYIKKASDEKNTTKLEELIADIIQAVETDPHLGLPTYVHGTTLKSVMPFLDEAEHVLIVQVTFAIKYDFTRTAP